MENKVLILARSQSLIERLIASLRGLIVFGDNLDPSSAVDLKNVQLVLFECNFSCNIFYCSCCMFHQIRNENIPFFILRPFLLKGHPQELKKYSINSLRAYQMSPIQKELLENVIKSCCYVLPPSLFSSYLSADLKSLLAQNEMFNRSHEIKNVATLAKQIGMSPSWLSWIYKDRAGRQIHDSLIRMKCCHSLWQLISTKKLIKTIAIELGFKPRTFTKNIVKVFGFTPADIRTIIIDIWLKKYDIIKKKHAHFE